MIKKNRQQKPIEHDIHLKYRCAKCGQDHWLSYLEASTKHFKIVCHCGRVFVVKRLSGFKLKYFKKPPVKIPAPVIDKPKIPLDLLNKSVNLLVGYGFSQPEATDLLNSSYQQNPIDDYSSLVKQTLKLLRK